MHPKGSGLARRQRVVKHMCPDCKVDSELYTQDGKLTMKCAPEGFACDKCLSPAYAFIHHGLPVNRHRKQGGLAAAMADGHGKYLRAVAWVDHDVEGGPVQKFVERFSPHPRITPYEPFARTAPAPGGRRR